MAFAVFMKMINTWGAGEGIAGFSQFVYNELVPATFTVPMHASFNVADGQSILVFGEMTSIQKTLYSKHGNEFLEYMNNVFLPSMQCPPETAQNYCQALQQYDNRAFKKYFQTFISEAKS